MSLENTSSLLKEVSGDLKESMDDKQKSSSKRKDKAVSVGKKSYQIITTLIGITAISFLKISWDLLNVDLKTFIISSTIAIILLLMFVFLTTIGFAFRQIGIEKKNRNGLFSTVLTAFDQALEEDFKSIDAKMEEEDRRHKRELRDRDNQHSKQKIELQLQQNKALIEIQEKTAVSLTAITSQLNQALQTVIDGSLIMNPKIKDEIPVADPRDAYDGMTDELPTLKGFTVKKDNRELEF